MDTNRKTGARYGVTDSTLDRAAADLTGTPKGSAAIAGSEWNAGALRPVAHWVLMPRSGGGQRLSMVWEVPDPIPFSFGS